MLSRAARAMCPGFVPRRSPISMPAACGSQCGAPRPTNAGTNTTPPVSGTLAASASTSAEEPISFRLSRSHCTTAPPMKMLPSSAYSSRCSALAASVVISRCFERTNLRAADVLQQEAARAVGVLGLARAPAQLPEQRRLLVAGDARNRHAAQAQRRGHFAHPLARPHHLRQHALGNAEDAQQLRVPLALHDVEEQRPRGIGHVRHMPLPAGQVPDQPAVDRAKGQLAPLGPRPRARHVVQNPRHFGRGEIRVQHQPRLVARPSPQRRSPPTRLHCAAVRRSCHTMARMNRLAGRPLPHNHRLALVGDADGRHIARPRARLAQRLHRAGQSGWSESPSDRAPPIPPADRTARTRAAPRRQSRPPRQKESRGNWLFPGPVQGCMPLFAVHLRHQSNTRGGARARRLMNLRLSGM